VNRHTLAPNSAELDPALIDPTEFNILLVTGHPDDEALVGGIAAANARRGLSTAALSATMGGASTEYHLPAETLPTDPGDFEQHLKRTRAKEFYKGVGSLGVRWAKILDLPDQEVSKEAHLHYLSEELAKYTFGLSGFYNENPWAIVTLGARGFDEHPDHSGTHDAACDASNILLQEYDLYTPVFGLNADGTGRFQIHLTDEMRRMKQAALTSHPSQMPLTKTGGLDPVFFERLGEHRRRYEEVLTVKETYDLYPPKVSHLLE